jgi:hypothetical protein
MGDSDDRPTSSDGRTTVRRMLRAGRLPQLAPRAAVPRSSIRTSPISRSAGPPAVRTRTPWGWNSPLAASPARRRLSAASWRAGGRDQDAPAPTPRGLPVDGWVSTPPHTPSTRALSPCQARWLLLRHPSDPDPEKHAYREQLLQNDSEIQRASTLTVAFEDLVRAREREEFAAWLDRAQVSDLPEFTEFARPGTRSGRSRSRPDL